MLFAGEVLLSGNKYLTDLGTYERAVADSVVGNETAFAAVGVTIHLAMSAVGVLVGFALVVLAALAFAGLSWVRAVRWLFGVPVLLWYGGLAAAGLVAEFLTGDATIPTRPR